jgi:hypothetical protein
VVWEGVEEEILLRIGGGGSEEEEEEESSKHLSEMLFLTVPFAWNSSMPNLALVPVPMLAARVSGEDEVRWSNVFEKSAQDDSEVGESMKMSEPVVGSVRSGHAAILLVQGYVGLCRVV